MLKLAYSKWKSDILLFSYAFKAGKMLDHPMFILLLFSYNQKNPKQNEKSDNFLKIFIIMNNAFVFKIDVISIHF